MKAKNKDSKGLSRRDFLVNGGISLGGMFVLFASGCAPTFHLVAKLDQNYEQTSGIKEFGPLFWFEILPDNRIQLNSPKAEMGQGIFTGFAMLAAEELEVSPEQISVVPATSNGPLDQIGTGGSSSTSALYEPIREVAATFREMLLNSAAKHWKVEKGSVKARNGSVVSGSKSLTYRQIADVTEKWTIPKKVKLKPPSEFKYVGTEMKRVDLLPKVMGEPIYAQDAEIPGMIYGASLQSPYIGGTLGKYDLSAAKKHEGVIDIYEIDGVLVVLAEKRYQSEMAKRKIQVEWNVPEVWTQEKLDERVQVGNGERYELQDKGNFKRQQKKADSKENWHTAAYRTPLAAHAHIEPNGAIAHVEKDKATFIVGLQRLNTFRNELAELLGFENEQIEIKNTFLGGGFGRRIYLSNIVIAAKASQKSGKPVCMFQDRQEEFQNAYYRPSTHHVLNGCVDNQGNIKAIQHEIASGDTIIHQVPQMVERLVGVDISSAHGARFIYDFPIKRSVLYRITMPFQTGIWRGVGMMANVFAIESFVDEMADKAGIDPLELRMKHLDTDDPRSARLHHLLKTTQKTASSSPIPADTGRGFACTDDRKTQVAAIAEIKVEAGQIQVKKVIILMDAGRIVNPDGVRMQCEGSVMMGLSTALYEGIRVEKGQIAVTNFHQYPVATLRDTPEIEVIMIPSDENPLGVGEPPLTVVPAAIANAVFNLTQIRLRELPLTLPMTS